MSKRAKKAEGRVIGKCECGGTVRGIKDLGRLWTWCEKCTPVEPITLKEALNVSLSALASGGERK